MMYRRMIGSYYQKMMTPERLE